MMLSICQKNILKTFHFITVITNVPTHTFFSDIIEIN